MSAAPTVYTCKPVVLTVNTDLDCNQILRSYELMEYGTHLDVLLQGQIINMDKTGIE